MPTKDQITQTLQRNIPYLESEFGVKRIGLFGSYGKDQPRAGSDIDLVIEFSRPIGFRFIDLAEYLEELLGAPVDILTPAGLEGIRVRRIAEEIQKSLVYV
jgi:predicted nucleotidyltransferase